MDVAERLAQTNGFNGFSYADIADEVGITTASLHYHFPTKAELGRQLVARYSSVFTQALADIDGGGLPPAQKLQRYARLYADVLRGKRMCLCGMLAAENSTLPAPMQAELRAFFDSNERWLARVLAEGRKSGDFSFAGAPLGEARMLLGALEGAMLVAHSYGDVSRFTAATRRLLAELER
jgi:TetR/AcrR family transcriptional repressor of nem operon